MTNLDDAIEIVRQINDVRQVQRELKSAFTGRALDGGQKAALEHPLYLDAQNALAALHEQLTLLI